MIIGKEVSPQNNVYHIGAKIIQVLKTYDSDSINYFEVYSDLNKIEKVSINLFSLALDWLYLLGVIDNKEGQLKRCF
mgnify:FL=1|tara:strand:- start:16672 stop:16902 length:231 start_codon:yes stop_codon:yes gene_type:complete